MHLAQNRWLFFIRHFHISFNNPIRPFGKNYFLTNLAGIQEDLIRVQDRVVSKAKRSPLRQYRALPNKTSLLKLDLSLELDAQL
jgi:hypothetical protein